MNVSLSSDTLLQCSLEDGQLHLEYYDVAYTLDRQDAFPGGYELNPYQLSGTFVLAGMEIEGQALDPAEEGISAVLRIDEETSLYWNREYGPDLREEAMWSYLGWESLYPDCANECWSLELYPQQDNNRDFKLTAVSEDELEMLFYSYYATGESYPSVLLCRFVRAEPDSVEIPAPPEPVTVGTVEELIEALQDDATILLEPGVYNVTGWLSFGDADMVGRWENVFYPIYAEGIYTEDAFDGPELVIAGYRNLTIRSADPDNPAEIVCLPRYADVLTFQNCAALTLENLILGHTEEQGYCSGAVVNLQDCYNASLIGCRLYGCGTYGVTASSSSKLTLENCEVYDCTEGCAELQFTDALFLNSNFHSCEGYTMFSMYFSDVEFEGCAFRELNGNMLYLGDYSSAVFRSCQLDEAARLSVEQNEHFQDRVTADWHSAPKG